MSSSSIPPLVPLFFLPNIGIFRAGPFFFPPSPPYPTFAFLFYFPSVLLIYGFLSAFFLSLPLDFDFGYLDLDSDVNLLLPTFGFKSNYKD